MDYKDLLAGQTKKNFWFKAKNDLIDILMEKAFKNKKSLKILNIGVGTGDDLKVLKKYGKNYIIDIDKDALSIIDNNLYKEKEIADACNLPYRNNYFDAVVSFDVFEHIEDDRKAVGEVFRVLKNDGMIIFTVPAFHFLFSSHDKALQHHRRYNKKGLKNLLSQFNLKIFFWNSLLFIPMAIMRILKRKSEPKVDQMDLPPWINAIFFKLLSFDNFIIKKGFSMPVGLSIVGFGFKQK